MASRGRPWIRLVLGIGIAAALLWQLGRQIEFEGLKQRLGAADPVWVAAGLLAFGAGLWVRAARWRLLLSRFSPGLSIAECFWPFVISLAANNTLPFRAGDVMRTVAFTRTLRTGVPQVLSTMFLERLLDFVVLVAIFLAGLPWALSGHLPAGWISAARLGGLAGALLVLFLVLAPAAPQALAGRLLRALPERVGRPLGSGLEPLFDGLAGLGSWRSAAGLFGLSLLGWALEGALFAAGAHALGLGSLGYGPWFAMAAGTLATLIPGTPGHIGTLDYFAVLGFRAYGVGAEPAIAATALIHLLLWLPVTLVGGIAYGALHGRTLWRSLRGQEIDS